MLDAANEPGCHSVVLMTSAQVGKTELISNTLAFYIAQDPAPILLLQPTLDMAEAYSKDRLAPMVRDTPALKGKIKDPRARDSGNTLLHKKFPGGHITMAGANSPSSLASRPIRVVLADEVDRYPVSAGTEGDPVSLAVKRTATFYNRKVILASTPTTKGASRIEKEYLESDQREYHVPCPDCGEMQPLVFEQLVWDDPSDVKYACKFCGVLIEQAQKYQMLRHGEWVAAAEFNGKAGFHINELYSPWRRWDETVADFLQKKDDVEQFKVWWNTALGLPWEHRGDAPEWEKIQQRSEPYEPGRIPAGGLLLVAGVDVQKDRLEAQVVAYGRGREAWSVEYLVIPGDTSTQQPFAQLDDLLLKEYPIESGGHTRIRRLAIDSGYETASVYTWARRHGPRAMIVKGSSQRMSYLIGAPKSVEYSINGKRIPGGAKVWQIATDLIKAETYSAFRKTDPGPGYVHFPNQYSDELFMQLTAESQVPRKLRRGYSRLEWVKNRDRNEALDTLVYARAAAASLGVDRMSDSQWDRMEAQLRDRRPAPSSSSKSGSPGASRQAPIESGGKKGNPARKRTLSRGIRI